MLVLTWNSDVVLLGIYVATVKVVLAVVQFRSVEVMYGTPCVVITKTNDVGSSKALNAFEKQRGLLVHFRFQTYASMFDFSHFIYLMLY